jgi:hypothetical protein
MGQRFQITESERKRIKGLYEQESPNKKLELGTLAHGHLRVYGVSVGIKDDDDDDSVRVDITLDYDGNFVGAEIDFNPSDNVTDEEALEFVIQKGKEGAFNSLPIYLAYDLERKEIFDTEP